MFKVGDLVKFNKEVFLELREFREDFEGRTNYMVHNTYINSDMADFIENFTEEIILGRTSVNGDFIILTPCGSGYDEYHYPPCLFKIDKEALLNKRLQNLKKLNLKIEEIIEEEDFPF